MDIHYELLSEDDKKELIYEYLVGFGVLNEVANKLIDSDFKKLDDLTDNKTLKIALPKLDIPKRDPKKYTTINKMFIDQLKGKTKTEQRKIVSKHFKEFKADILYNNRKFNLNDNFAKYTIKSMRNTIENYISKDKDLDKLATILNNRIKLARKYNEQLNEHVSFVFNSLNNDDESQMYEYIITHPIKTYHSAECLARQSKRYFTKEEMLLASTSLPQHSNCRCYFKRTNYKPTK